MSESELSRASGDGHPLRTLGLQVAAECQLQTNPELSLDPNPKPSPYLGMEVICDVVDDQLSTTEEGQTSHNLHYQSIPGEAGDAARLCKVKFDAETIQEGALLGTEKYFGARTITGFVPTNFLIIRIQLRPGYKLS